MAENILTRKYGPLPGWAWGLITVGGGYVGLRWYQARKAAAGTASSTTTAVPASSSPNPWYGSGFGSGVGGGYGANIPATTTDTTTTGTLSTEPVGGVTPVAPALSAPAPVPVPAIPAGLQPSYLLGLGLTPDQISGVLQPQNQPGVNPNVSPAPTQALPVGGSVGPATGTGQRYLSPGPNPFPFTFG